jgi:hypothetical protein
MAKPGAARTARSINVAGKHKATSQAAVSAASEMAVTSASSRLVPCIFQFPATSFLNAIWQSLPSLAVPDRRP